LTDKPLTRRCTRTAIPLRSIAAGELEHGAQADQLPLRSSGRVNVAADRASACPPAGGRTSGWSRHSAPKNKFSAAERCSSAATFDETKMKKYSDIKPILTESILKAFPQTEGDEIEAVVTHWLQSPSAVIPYLTPSMRDHCWCIAGSTKSRRKAQSVCEPQAAYQARLPIDWADVPFPPPKGTTFTFVDLFAGIGGFRIAMQELGGACIFSSEWDPYAKRTYEANFGEVPYGDIRKISEDDIPDHDILCAGFPCQPFSLAGVSARNSLNTAHGFACETQGTLFFDIARIMKAKRPRVAFLENVKNLIGHDGGKTFSVIKNTIAELGYSFSYKVIDSSPLVPQRRLRCYMVCVRDSEQPFVFPTIQGPPLPLKTILEKNVDESFTISSKLWEGHQRRTKQNLARGTGFTAFCADLDKLTLLYFDGHYKKPYLTITGGM
jgi:DNA (cytosine-5)-methyltransferase 1